MNKLDQLEGKVHNQQIEIGQLKLKVTEHQIEMNQLELKVNEQQVEIDQLKKKNVEFESKLESISSTQLSNGNRNVKAVASASVRDFLPRSCYELKATNPSAQSGLYFIDPDGQINGDDPVQAYCDMDTSI